MSRGARQGKVGARPNFVFPAQPCRRWGRPHPFLNLGVGHDPGVVERRGVSGRFQQHRLRPGGQDSKMGNEVAGEGLKDRTLEGSRERS